MKLKRSRRLVVPLAVALAAGIVVAAFGFGRIAPQANAAAPAPAAADVAVGQLVLDGKTIPVLSYSEGVMNTVDLGGGGGGSTGKAVLAPLSLIKPVDASSTALHAAVATGKHFPKAVLTVKWGTGTAQQTMTIELTTVFVTSVEQSGVGGQKPTEAVSLAFGAIKWEYTDSAGTTSSGAGGNA